MFTMDVKRIATAIRKGIPALEAKIRALHPEIVALFVKPQTDTAFQLVRRGLDDDADASVKTA